MFHSKKLIVGKKCVCVQKLGLIDLLSINLVIHYTFTHNA